MLFPSKVLLSWLLRIFACFDVTVVRFSDVFVSFRGTFAGLEVFLLEARKDLFARKHFSCKF
jgi:hypothetical protein